jgi:hypothetical protein
MAGRTVGRHTKAAAMVEQHGMAPLHQGSATAAKAWQQHVRLGRNIGQMCALGWRTACIMHFLVLFNRQLTQEPPGAAALASGAV